MGRLIDADALIETMKKVETEYEDAMTCPSWWTAYSVISEQPTAYDVEKVVAKMKDRVENHDCVKCKCYDDEKYECNVETTCKDYTFECLYYIVKRGGVE